MVDYVFFFFSFQPFLYFGMSWFLRTLMNNYWNKKKVSSWLLKNIGWKLSFSIRYRHSECNRTSVHELVERVGSRCLFCKVHVCSGEGAAVAALRVCDACSLGETEHKREVIFKPLWRHQGNPHNENEDGIRGSLLWNGWLIRISDSCYLSPRHLSRTSKAFQVVGDIR